MKKIIVYLLVTSSIGLLLSYYMFMQYDVEEAMSSVENVYLLETGIYSNIDEMKNNTKFTYYIYSEEVDGIHTYVAITKDNKDKLINYYQNQDIIVTPKEITITNKTFLETLKQYDDLLKTTEETKIIENIIYQVLSKYEEANDG